MSPTTAGFVPSSFAVGTRVGGPVSSVQRCATRTQTGRLPAGRRGEIVASGNDSSKDKSSGGDKGAAKKGLFGRLKDSVLRSVVTVPGGGKPGADLLECVFCKGAGTNDCDACKGSGVDAMGTCLMCDGKTYLSCTVCNGVGTVDRIRRGGTDDRNEFVIKKKRRS